jgi:hypothetical protein
MTKALAALLMYRNSIVVKMKFPVAVATQLSIDLFTWIFVKV